ncbi:MAG: radical SAM family heme chaperone HemW [Candidatus Babeliales bacterium]
MRFNNTVQPEYIYLHWPFCPYKCHFCDFVALASHEQFMEQYHEALCQEIMQFGQRYAQKMPVKTIFLGGGTPSTYPDRLLLDMFDTLRKVYNFDHATEVSIEVNPGTVRDEQLLLWEKVGINRLSIGVQSLKDAVLKKLNRHQLATDVQNLLEKASKRFNNISVDLILGLPGVSEADWKSLIEQVVAWPIKHVSIYFLTVHENTPLYFNIQRKRVTLPHDESLVDLYHWSRDILQQHGFLHYEISNFAKEGFQSRHNTAYWNHKPYIGLGLGACSFDGQRRFQNSKNLMHYINGVNNHEDVVYFEESLTMDQQWLETVMLGLRQIRGFDINASLAKLPKEQQEKIRKKIGELEQRKFVEYNGDNLILTPTGLVLENEVIIALSP